MSGIIFLDYWIRPDGFRLSCVMPRRVSRLLAMLPIARQRCHEKKHEDFENEILYADLDRIRFYFCADIAKDI